MVVWRVPLVFLLMLLPLAGASWDDPAGDQEAGYYTQHWDDEPAAWLPVQQQGWYPVADVLSVGVAEETPDALVWEVRVAGTGTGQGAPLAFPYYRYTLDFTFHDEPRRAEFRYMPEEDHAVLRLSTLDEVPSGQQTFVRQTLDAVYDAEALPDGAGWRVVMPKRDLRDSGYVPLRAGDVLSGFTGSAQGGKYSYVSPCATNAPETCWKVRDALGPLGDVRVEKDPPGQGHLLLRTDAPLRGSNGEAATFLYNVTLRNLDDVADAVLLQAGGQPPEWEVRMPGVVDLPPGGSVDVPVAVTVPFRHQHGLTQTMQVRAASQAVPGIESLLEVGIVWHSVPQPAGHHDTLWLHARDGFGWMNTLAEDPEATGGTISWNSGSFSSGLEEETLALRYNVRLSPRLAMGLDLDPEGTLEATLPLVSDRAEPATVSLSLQVQHPDGAVTLAEGTQEVDLVAGETDVSWSLPVEQAGDRVPFRPDSDLVLVVGVDIERERSVAQSILDDGSATPGLAADGARVRLPLNEYRDVVDQGLLSSLARLSLEPLTEAAKPVNPGRTAAFAFRAHNAESGAETVVWRLEGAHADWAQVYPARSTIPGRGNGTVLVTVTPPEGAADGEAAEVLLVGQSSRDARVQAFARLVAQVTTATDVPDESALADELRGEAARTVGRDSPLPLLVPLAALAVAAARRGRR